jgi:hypothetical protein
MKIGLIAGRHPLPVEKYLISESTVDFSQAHIIAAEAMKKLVASTPNDATIQLYATGLSRALLGAINGFLMYQQDATVVGGEVSKRTLEIWEYNAETKKYESVISYSHYGEYGDASVIEYGRISVQQ